MPIRGIGQPIDSPISQSAVFVATAMAVLDRDPDYSRYFKDPYAQWFAAGISAEARALFADLSGREACRALIARLEDHPDLAGAVSHMAYRKPWVEQALRRALAAGCRQVVVFGAGCDTVTLRARDAIGTLPVFELDLPAAADYRRACLIEHGALTPNLHVLGVDFQREHFADRLAQAGYDPALRTAFIAEAVLEFLSPEEVDTLFAFVRDRSAPGSRIVFSFALPKAQSDDRLAHMRAQNQQGGERFGFGLRPEELDGFLAARGLRRLELADPAFFKREVTAHMDVKVRVLRFFHLASAETLPAPA
ncbi:MAG: class I SAM-dependent methyltransferase [Gammaproteobacteria bacterium]